MFTKFYRLDLGVIFLLICNSVMANDLCQNFVSHSISGEQTDRIPPNVVYAFIYIESRLRLSPVIFCLFVTELWPLIDVRILLLLNALNVFRTWPFRVTVTLTSFLDCVWSKSPILFEVVIPNLVCMCIWGWRSITCFFRAM